MKVFQINQETYAVYLSDGIRIVKASSLKEAELKATDIIPHSKGGEPERLKPKVMNDSGRNAPKEVIKNPGDKHTKDNDLSDDAWRPQSSDRVTITGENKS